MLELDAPPLTLVATRRPGRQPWPAKSCLCSIPIMVEAALLQEVRNRALPATWPEFASAFDAAAQACGREPDLRLLPPLMVSPAEMDRLVAKALKP